MTRTIVQNDLKNFAPFKALSIGALRQLLEHSSNLKIRKQTYLYEAHHPTTHVYFLLNGVLKYGHYFSSEREVVRGIHFPGAFFGIDGLLGKPTYDAFATTLYTEAQYLEIPTTTIQQIAEKEPCFVESIIEYVARRLEKAEQEVAGMLLYDVRERVERFLFEQEKFIDTTDGFEPLFKMGITQQDIASIVGATRQTVALVLNDLRKKKEGTVYHTLKASMPALSLLKF